MTTRCFAALGNEHESGNIRLRGFITFSGLWYSLGKLHHSEPPKPMQKFINLLSLVVFTTALAAGQVMFKQVGLTIRGRPLLEGAVDILGHHAFYFALCLYAFATFLWIWILSRVPLSQAYPWVAIGIAIVPLLGWYVFGERIKPTFWLGVLLILSGVIITQVTSQSS